MSESWDGVVDQAQHENEILISRRQEALNSLDLLEQRVAVKSALYGDQSLPSMEARLNLFETILRAGRLEDSEHEMVSIADSLLAGARGQTTSRLWDAEWNIRKRILKVLMALDAEWIDGSFWQRVADDVVAIASENFITGFFSADNYEDGIAASLHENLAMICEFGWEIERTSFEDIERKLVAESFRRGMSITATRCWWAWHLACIGNFEMSLEVLRAAWKDQSEFHVEWLDANDESSPWELWAHGGSSSKVSFDETREGFESILKLSRGEKSDASAKPTP